MSLGVIVLLFSFIYLFVCFRTVVFDFTLGPLVSLNLRELKTKVVVKPLPKAYDFL